MALGDGSEAVGALGHGVGVHVHVEFVLLVRVVVGRVQGLRLGLLLEPHPPLLSRGSHRERRGVAHPEHCKVQTGSCTENGSM